MGIVNVLSNGLNPIKSNPAIVLPLLLYTVFVGALAFALIVGPATVMQVAIAKSALTSTSAIIAAFFSAFNIPGIILFAIVAILLSPLFTATYIDLASQYSKGKKPMFGSAFDTAKKRYFSLLGANIIVCAAFFLSMILAFIIFALSGRGNLVIGLIIGLIFFICAFIFIVIDFVVPATVVIEGNGAIAGIKSAIEIGKKHWPAIIIIILFTGLISAIVSGVVSFILGVGHQTTLTPGYIVNLIVSGTISVWATMLPAMFYYEYISKAKSAPSTTPSKIKKQRK